MNSKVVCIQFLQEYLQNMANKIDHTHEILLGLQDNPHDFVDLRRILLANVLSSN